MVAKEIIDFVTQALVKVYQPEKIYIFGSYAWGTPHEESDLDVMVIVKESPIRPLQRAVPGLLALAHLEQAKDLLVMTQQEFDDRADDTSKLAYAVKNHGICIYSKS